MNNSNVLFMKNMQMIYKKLLRIIIIKENEFSFGEQER